MSCVSSPEQGMDLLWVLYPMDGHADGEVHVVLVYRAGQHELPRAQPQIRHVRRHEGVAQAELPDLEGDLETLGPAERPASPPKGVPRAQERSYGLQLRGLADVRVAVNPGEVPDIDAVLRDLLHVAAQPDGHSPNGRPVGGVHVGDVEAGLSAGFVMPRQHHAVALDHRPAAGPSPRRRSGVVAGGHAVAFGVEAEAVEGAAHRLADHVPAMRQVRAEVRAVRVQPSKLSGGGAKHDQLTAGELAGAQGPRWQLVGEGDRVPARGE